MPKKVFPFPCLTESDLKKIALHLMPPIDCSYLFTWAEIRPKPNQSGRIGRGRFYKDPKVALYEYAIRRDFKKNQINKGIDLTGALSCDIVCSFKSNDYCFNISRPDVDNLQKPILDSLKNEVIGDDSNIARITLAKIKIPMEFVAVRLSKLPSLEDCLRGLTW